MPVKTSSQATAKVSPQTKKAPKDNGAKNKPAAATVPEPQRKILYPEPETKLRIGEKAINAAFAKKALGWETEADYKVRRVTEDKIDPAAATYGDEFMLRDGAKQKVRCWHNSKNRPFAEAWARALSQDILTRNWQFNGETIIISKYGTILSGQHRLAGLVFAHERWAKSPERWKELWPTEPTIECVMVLGIEETPKVVRTLDNVKPRSLSDNIFTSPMFDGLSNLDRLLCSKMLQSAFKIMWNRTGAGHPLGSNEKVYDTSPTAISFIELHPKLLDCVKHIFEENKGGGRAISTLGFPTVGICAGMMYLMASSASDIDVYRNSDPPGEKVLDMGYYDRAKLFWTRLANSKLKDFQHVRKALSLVVAEEEDGGLGSAIEKRAIICKAWKAWAEGRNPTADDVRLSYDIDPEDSTSKTFLEAAETCGGIDIGEAKEVEEGTGAVAELSEAEIQQRAEQLQKDRTQELVKKVEGLDPDHPTLSAKVGDDIVTRPLTRKEIAAQQTAKAKANDEADKAAAKATPQTNGATKPGTKPGAKVSPQGNTKAAPQANTKSTAKVSPQASAKVSPQASAKRPGNASK